MNSHFPAFPDRGAIPNGEIREGGSRVPVGAFSLMESGLSQQYSLPLLIESPGQAFAAIPSSIRYAVSFSSGISSWAAARRIVDQEGPEGMVLVFADTLIEDEDNYRFLYESAANLGAALVKISDGRNPMQVMRDARIIGNSMIDPCSKILKRELLDRWRDAYCCQATTKLVLGIAWDESHRIEEVQKRNQPWQYIAPLCDKPWISKAETLQWARSHGIEPPRMYGIGFEHANCGGGCIKAGQKPWSRLLSWNRPRYLTWEDWEQDMRQVVGDHSILRDRRKNAESQVLTLRDFRLRIESGQAIDETDIGGCACALPL